MKNILVLGAGLSASTLIQYLLDHAESLDWHVKIGDVSLELAQRKVNKHPRGEAFTFDVNAIAGTLKRSVDANKIFNVFIFIFLSFELMSR